MNYDKLVLRDLINHMRLFLSTAEWVPEHSVELYAGYGIMAVTGGRIPWREIDKIHPEFASAWEKEELDNIKLGLNRQTGEPLRIKKEA